MDNPKERACAYVDTIADQLINVSRDIYEHPELKFEEFRASQLLAEKLQGAGFATKLGVAGLETAIHADHPAVSNGPTVAIISEYDALPEIGHACGHNLIAPPAWVLPSPLERSREIFLGSSSFLAHPEKREAVGRWLWSTPVCLLMSTRR